MTVTSGSASVAATLFLGLGTSFWPEELESIAGAVPAGGFGARAPAGLGQDHPLDRNVDA